MELFARTSGLLWGLSVRDGVAARMTDDTAADVLAQPHDWTWMHFALSDHRARRFLENFDAAPAAARALLLSGETRPQIHLSADCAFGVIPDFEREFEGPSLSPGRVAFWLDARHLVTARQHPLRVVDEVRQEVEDGAAPASPALVFLRLNERYMEIVGHRFVELARTLDHAEDAILSDRGKLDPSGLGPVRRELARYHRQFAGLRGAYHRALAGKDAHASCPVRPHLPELLQATEDLDHDAAALGERGRLLYEEMDTRIAAATNRSLQTLTIISTLLLPATFVVGAFGMNVPTIPWANSFGGFWWATGLCIAVVGACWAALKRYEIL